MNRIHVKSSDIRSIGWEPDEDDGTAGTLEIEYIRNNKIYTYFDVSEQTYKIILKAESVGRAARTLLAENSYTERLTTT